MKIEDTEITKDNVELLVGCIPLSEFKNPPPSQINCESEECPVCLKKMWTSERKRKLREKNMKLVCWFCFIKILGKLKIDPTQITLADVLKTN